MNAAPWMLAIGEDYRYRETAGGSPTLMTRFMHRYMDQVVRLATRSVAVRKVLLRAFNMLVPPTALFNPRVLFRVLLQVIKPAPIRTFLATDDTDFIPSPSVLIRGHQSKQF